MASGFKLPNDRQLSSCNIFHPDRVSAECCRFLDRDAGDDLRVLHVVVLSAAGLQWQHRVLVYTNTAASVSSQDAAIQTLSGLTRHAAM